MMAIKLEARAYGPDSTPEEVAAIGECIYMHAPDIMMYREVPVQSLFQLDIFDQRMTELAKDLASFALIIDLTIAHPPSAEVRQRLKRLFGSFKNMRRVTVFTGRNFMLNVAAKFVLGGLGLKALSIHKTLEDALEATRRDT
jgi:hypothetical protein